MAELKYEYRLLESGDIEVVKVIGNVSELIVPPSIDGYRLLEYILTKEQALRDPRLR